MSALEASVASRSLVDIDLAGFGHAGWEWHPFAAEKQLVDSYIAAGRLRRFAGKPFVSSSQGA